MNKFVVIIPARYYSSRFPGKPLALINGKPMIQWVYERVNCVAGIYETYVATDDERIQKCVWDFNGKCIMTSAEHQCGTDRLVECVDILGLNDEDIVLNIQGDEPLIKEDMVRKLMETICDEDTVMGTLKEKITKKDDVENTNVVKVVTDQKDNALYFSRYSIPFNRNNVDNVTYCRHIGVYAYRAGFLKNYPKLKKSKLEEIEGLEQLRVLENGYKIKVLETESISLGVDTPEQLEIVERLMKKGV